MPFFEIVDPKLGSFRYVAWELWIAGWAVLMVALMEWFETFTAGLVIQS
jgi:hypothetical protein